jgi:DNA polymerase-3 subunit alpha
LLSSGSIILVDGKLSVKDDEIKLIAEKISVAPKNTVTPSKDEGKGSGTGNKKKGIFLRLETADFEKIEAIKNLISIFEGNMPVYLYFKDTNKYEFLGQNLLTSVNKPLEFELKRILGEENVVVVV